MSHHKSVNRAGAAIALASAILISAGCGARYVIAEPRLAPEAGPPEVSLTRHVVLVSIDGLRPDAIEAYKAPALQKLVNEGSFTLSASTISPSKTLPSHTSMLTGEPPDVHGVLWNNVVSAKADVVETPTIFSVARSRGYRTAAFFSKSKFHALQQRDALDYSQAPGGWFGRWSSDRTIGDVERYLAQERPNLLFVHLPDPDAAGHAHGWMSTEYGEAVAAADTAIARLRAAADRAFGEGAYALIVTADHGGHDRDHGSDDPRDMTIPWIAWGRGVSRGPLNAPVRTMDTAATVVWLLGLDEPEGWVGAPIVDAFDQPGLTAEHRLTIQQ
jgi:arylsulfatase A-like enzyme